MKKLALLFCVLLSVMAFAQIDYSVKFKITAPNGHTDETIIRLEQTATEYFDGQWDAWKIFTWNDSVPSFFSHSADSFELAINAIPFMTEDTSMFLSTRIPLISGVYQMETEQLGDYPPGIQYALRDLENNMIYPLNSNQVFNFNVTASLQDTERFELFYSAESIIDTVSHSAIISNLGSVNWLFEILDAGSTTVDFGTSTSEVLQIDSLLNGTYVAIITDEFNLTDSIYFVIDSAEPIDTDPPFNSALLAQKERLMYIYEANGKHYLKSLGIESQDLAQIDYFSLTGHLLKTEFINFSAMNDYALFSAMQPMIVRINSTYIQQSFKLSH